MAELLTVQSVFEHNVASVASDPGDIQTVEVTPAKHIAVLLFHNSARKPQLVFETMTKDAFAALVESLNHAEDLIGMLGFCDTAILSVSLDSTTVFDPASSPFKLSALDQFAGGLENIETVLITHLYAEPEEEADEELPPSDDNQSI